ncbi:ATP-binding cassette domain-containing protein [Salinispirillum marinum]|uniref:ATP-binding cassette domain-containing protein n=2 Tax=Saccharospirillaceae TaxID=255527 RepID=A0ABV8BGC6_9GAMM
MLDVKELHLLRAGQVWRYNFQVPRGTGLALMGQSGAGKTSLLECLGGFLPAQSGQILLDSVPIHGLPPEQRPTSTLFQDHNLFEHLTVAQNLALGFQQGKPSPAQWARLQAACEVLDVVSYWSRLPSALSGGQRQRVALIRTVLREQPVILLDEPFSALDDGSRERAGAWVQDEIRRARKVLVFVTHQQADAERWAEQVVEVTT